MDLLNKTPANAASDFGPDANATDEPRPSFPGLSKTRFLAGLQCSRLLWWRVHEPNAPELVADDSLQALLDQGTRVGELARQTFPGGVLIPNDAERLRATRTAIDCGAIILYEASFAADDTFAAVDLLVREQDGWHLIEVKCTTSVKDQHISDAALQMHVVERAGLRVAAVEIMHLNRGCRYPVLSNLFTRVDVTSRVRERLSSVPALVEQQLAVLRGPLPFVETGSQCDVPYTCPFKSRCWASLPAHHVSSLYRGGNRVAELLAEGVERIDEIAEPLAGVMERQRRAIQAGALLVEGDLAAALVPFVGPLAFLDFETVGLAIPAWPGCAPYDAVPVQFSVHVDDGGDVQQKSWLAEGSGDPRRPLAEALLGACAGATILVAYNASFERRVLADLAAFCPDLAPALLDLRERVVDLLPVVRNHVYHPAFGGGFGLKAVLPALVAQGYDDLVITDGGAASAALMRLLFEPLADDERQALRRDLVAYCARDTWGLVLLLRRLRELAT